MADNKKEEKGFFTAVAEGAANAVSGVALAADSVATTVGNKVAAKNDRSISDKLSDLGVTDKAEKAKLVAELNRRNNVSALIDKNGAGTPSAQEIALGKALVNKWRQDDTLLKKIDQDLSDPSKKAKVEGLLANNPAALTNVVSQYNGQNMDTLLSSLQKPAPAAEKRFEQRLAPANAALAATAEPVPHKGTTMAPSQKAAITPADVKQGAKTEVTSVEDQKLFKSAFETLAEGSNENIIDSINPKFVKSLAQGMSASAVTKYGVDPVVAKGFSESIGGNNEPAKELAEKIEKNLKNNPDFVRQLALASKDNSDVPDSIKEEAKKMMTEVMANPEKLSEDKYVKDLESKMRMKSTMSGIGGMLDKFLPAGMGASIMGWFGEIFEKIKSFFSGFSGKPVLSMSNGSGLLPTVMVHTRNFQENRDNAAAFSRYQPTDMTAYADKVNGSPFHTEPVLDSKGNQVTKDGQPVSRELPNTITVKDLDGKEHKVIPSVGALQAKQEKGAYDASGNWKAGNVHVPVVTGIDKLGNSNKIDSIIMTPEKFDDYKKDMESRSGRTYPFAAYTEANARQEPATPITRIDAKNGAVLGTENVSPVGVQPGVAVAYPVQPQPNIVGRPLDAASNDPEYKLQANKPF